MSETEMLFLHLRLLSIKNRFKATKLQKNYRKSSKKLQNIRRPVLPATDNVLYNVLNIQIHNF